jgi:hypothetical protein
MKQPQQLQQPFGPLPAADDFLWVGLLHGSSTSNAVVPAGHNLVAAATSGQQQQGTKVKDTSSRNYAASQ